MPEVSGSGHRGEGEKMSEQLTQEQRDLALLGKCPYCKRGVKGWKPMLGSFAPEWWATMDENGIDAATGHRKDCAYKDIRL